MTVEINDASFEQEVIKSDVPTLVDFWAAWCGPCRMLGPVIDKLSEDAEYKDKFKFCKINVDENPQMAQKYQVMSIPLVLFFKGGEQVDQSLGAVPENAIKEKISAII
ncbi:thioredoxin [Chloroflexota bacterium]